MIVRVGTRVLVQASDTGLYALLENTRWNYFDLPGGKYEANETTEMCLNRELTEELGISVDTLLYGWVGLVAYKFPANRNEGDEYCFFTGGLFETFIPTGEYCKTEENYVLHWVTLDEMLEKVTYLKDTPDFVEWKKFTNAEFDADEFQFDIGTDGEAE